MKTYNLKTVPNQKVIEIELYKPEKKETFSIINNEAFYNAQKVLNDGAFRLWCYFSMNQNGYIFALSNKDVEDRIGVKKQRYDNAMLELCSKKFLITENGKDFTFIQFPEEYRKEKSVVFSQYNDNKEENPVVLPKDNGLYLDNTRNKKQEDKTNSIKQFAEMTPAERKAQFEKEWSL